MANLLIEYASLFSTLLQSLNLSFLLPGSLKYSIPHRMTLVLFVEEFI